jgi:hypothetical protein
MSTPNGVKKTQFHPTARRQVIATADVSMMQAQVVDKSGEVRAIVVWKCGPDVYWADTMDGLFDNARRKRAPEWLLEQLAAVPTDKQFDSNGLPKGVTTSSEGGKAVTKVTPSHVPSADADVPQFAQV